MSIYTKTGDKGKTGLFGCKDRIGKDSPRIEAIGAVDELNSFLGITVSVSEDREVVLLLKEIQESLLTIGSILAGSSLKFSKARTTKLEKLIDKWEKDLPVLKNFVLPGGAQTASYLQFCRSLTRCAERRVMSLSRVEKVTPQVLMYMNRLSDFFFMFARKVNFELKIRDEVWISKNE